MEPTTSRSILAKVRAKQADLQAQPPQASLPFADAVNTMNDSQLRGQAWGDVGNLALAGVGVGLAGRGVVGLVNTLMRNRQKKQRSGPAMLPLPYPVEPTIKAAISSKWGIPTYGPAMLFGGMGGFGLGWKGMDALLQSQRQREADAELERSRQEFHDALLSQYDAPIKTHPALAKPQAKAASEPSTMTKVGEALDRAFDAFSTSLAKAADFDWNNVPGALAGGYGMYAGLTGLTTGAIVYDKLQKRSRRAILEKALQRRQRRQSMQRPTEIFAVPEPVTRLPKISPQQEASLIAQPPEG